MYSVVQATIEEMVDRGVPLDLIEGVISDLDLPAEQQDALAIWAWAWQESGRTFSAQALLSYSDHDKRGGRSDRASANRLARPPRRTTASLRLAQPPAG